MTYEAEVRGLVCRLVGPDEDILAVGDPLTARQVMVVAIPSWPAGWMYLWGGGGAASAADPAHAAELVAAAIGR